MVCLLKEHTKTHELSSVRVNPNPSTASQAPDSGEVEVGWAGKVAE